MGVQLSRGWATSSPGCGVRQECAPALTPRRDPFLPAEPASSRWEPFHPSTETSSLPAASPTGSCILVQCGVYFIGLRVFSLQSGVMKSRNLSVSSGARD